MLWCQHETVLCQGDQCVDNISVLLYLDELTRARTVKEDVFEIVTFICTVFIIRKINFLCHQKPNFDLERLCKTPDLINLSCWCAMKNHLLSIYCFWTHFGS